MTLLSYTFVTLAQVKRQLGITGAAQDALLDDLINYATDFVERYIGRRVVEETQVDETHDGQLSRRIFTRNRPINSMDPVTVEVDGVAVTIDKIDYVNGIIQLESCVQEDLANIEVTYTAGYNTTDPTTVPWDLQQAVIDIVSNAKNSVKSSGISSETVGDYSVTYGDVEKSVTSSVKQILNSYKRFL